MNVLIACEESQRVCIEFRAKGHNAFSCDLQECSGGHPEWHIKGDVLDIINGHDVWCAPFPLFRTQDGKYHDLPKRWDLIIAHPPCTYLTCSGNRWFNVEKYGEKALARIEARKEAIDFFMAFVNADCDKIAIENPIGIMSTQYKKPTQIIHPYYFAESEDSIDCTTKATCLWLKGLSPLTYTIKFEPQYVTRGGKNYSKWYLATENLPKNVRAKERSKTFLSIAKAMAEQWG